MPIIQNIDGQIEYTPQTNGERAFYTGVVEDDIFAICDTINVLKQIKFDIVPQSPGLGTLTIQADIDTDETFILTNIAAFSTIQTPSGTFPTADALNDTLTLISSDGSVQIIGDSSTDTIDLRATTSGSSVSSLNGLTGDISLKVGSSGNDFNIDAGSTEITLNIPSSSSTDRGLLTSTDWTTFNSKQNALGYTPANKAGDTFTGAVIESVSTLTDAANISVNAALGNIFTVTLGGNRTLSNPTGATNGQKLVFRIRQDGTGSRTLAFDTKFRFSDSIPSITLSTAANSTDYIGVIYHSSDDKFDVVAFSQGYA